MRGSSAIATGNYESKNTLIVFGSFLMLVILVTSVVIFYISNNIVLTELGYKYLIDAFSMVIKEIPKSILIIRGNGPLKSELEKIIFLS